IVKLAKGAREWDFPEVIGQKDESCTYEAVLTPLHVEDARGKVLVKGLPGDRLENNRASTSVVARGKSRVLLIENKYRDEKTGNKLTEHKLLIDRLREANPERQLRVMDVDNLPADGAGMMLLLSDVDCVILANIPCEKLTDVQQEAIR